MSAPVSYGRDYPDGWADEPPDDIVPALEQVGVPDGHGWPLEDLTKHLEGPVERPPPSVGLMRTDGVQLLYAGKAHTLMGQFETGKSWFALRCAAAELLAGNVVGYVHFEEPDGADTVERLLLLGVPADAIRDRFRFTAPEDMRQQPMVRLLAPPFPTLVVLDGVNEAVSLIGEKVNDSEGASRFKRMFVNPCNRVGAATLQLDHVNKNPDTRGMGPGGSGQKGNNVNGATISLEPADAFGRGMRGRSHVFVTKDRPGYLRAKGRQVARGSSKYFMGEFVVDDTRTLVTFLDVTFFAPKREDGDDRAEAAPVATLCDDIYRVLCAESGGRVPSLRFLMSALRDAKIKTRDTLARDALTDLIRAGRVAETPGRGTGTGYRVVSASQDHGEESS